MRYWISITLGLIEGLLGALRTLNNLGVLHKHLEMYEEAESYHIKALQGREKILGEFYLLVTEECL